MTVSFNFGNWTLPPKKLWYWGHDFLLNFEGLEEGFGGAEKKNLIWGPEWGSSGASCLHQNLEEDAAKTRKLPRSCHQGINCVQIEPADSDTEIGIGFPHIAPADNNKGYVRRQDENMPDSTKRKRLESKLS